MHNYAKFICMLSDDTQKRIENDLRKVYKDLDYITDLEQEIDRAMDSRLGDLENAIDITVYEYAK